METQTIAHLTDWVIFDATKRAAENWQGSVWIPSLVLFSVSHNVYCVERTRRITPHKFKQHNHG